MSKPKWLIPRRSLLRGVSAGAGVALALPVMEAMFGTEREALAQMARPDRYMFFGNVNGFGVETFRPTGSGRNFDLTQNPWGHVDGFSAMSPLEPYKDDLLIMSGVGTHGKPYGFQFHGAGTGIFLSGIHKQLADKVGADTPYPLLELACGTGVLVDQSRTLHTPVTDPQVLFDQVLAGGQGGGSDPQSERLAKNRQSVIDSVLDQGNSLRARLGKADTIKLDEYLNGLRTVEQRLQDRGCSAAEDPSGSADFLLRFEDMMDLATLIFQCDLSRVIVFFWSGQHTHYEFDPTESPLYFKVIPELADLSDDTVIHRADQHHEVSHWVKRGTGSDLIGFVFKEYVTSPDRGRKTRGLIDRFIVQNFTTVIDRLKQATGADGRPLLDSSLVMLGNEMMGLHNSLMPVVIAGKGNGAVTTGRHLEFDGGPEAFELLNSNSGGIGYYQDLLLAILETAGIQGSVLGRTTPIPGFTE